MNKWNPGRQIKWMVLAMLGMLIGGNSSAQGTVKPDSLKEMLCKTWEVNYVLVEGAKIERMPGAADIVYEFKPDGTFMFNPEDAMNSVNGKWEYDPEKKLIRLFSKPDRKPRIISLLPGELVMLVKPGSAASHDSEDMKLVFRVKKD